MFLKAKDLTETQKLASFVKNANTFLSLYPQEKVYLHFDNTGYFAGESIWFKAYVVTAEDNIPSQLSKVLYVELLSPEGNTIKTLKLKVENGQADGSFHLESEMFGGYYQIRAYTRCMLNFGEECIFSRTFPVFDQIEQPKDYISKKMTLRRHKIPVERVKSEFSDKVDMSFFPEGGKLVAGLTSKVAFKATGKLDENIDVKGAVYDNQGNEVAAIATIHDGMGAFDFIPQDGQVYKAKVVYKGKNYEFDLPAIEKQGYVLKMDNLHPKQMIIQVEKSESIPGDTLGLTVASRGKIYAFSTVTAADGAQVMRIPKEILPSGVVQVTLFNTQGEIMAERLSFIKHQSALSIKGLLAKDEFEPYEKISIVFDVKDLAGNPVETAFSLSVKDPGLISNESNAGNIMTNLLLSSDIKGFINNPEYYFADDSRDRLRALDLLMLVQGWRRYNWKQMVNPESFQVRHGIEEGLILQGKIKSTSRKKAKGDMNILMWAYSPEGMSQRGTCITDEEGYFSFKFDDFFGVWNMSIQVTDKDNNRKNEHVQLDRNFSPEPKAYSFYDTQLNDANRTAIGILGQSDKTEVIGGVKDDGLMSYLLDEVMVSTKQKRKLTDEIIGVTNILYDVYDDVEKIRDSGKSEPSLITEYLVNTNSYFSYNMRTGGDNGEKVDNHYFYKGRPVVFYVNNFIVGGQASMWKHIDEITVDMVEKVAIMEEFDRFVAVDFGEALYANEVRHNIVGIYIYTNEKGDRRRDPKGIRNTKIQGYTQMPEFYSPKYASAALPDETDFRRTLYWNPNVKTDATGSTAVTFYNNSIKGGVDIDAQTVTNSGILGVYIEEKE
ncbi:hypothetical protein D0T53_09315 [Dysgonomonas sp. 216]|nr:hypothetical protein [Dysgonomonas sp. 216]